MKILAVPGLPSKAPLIVYVVHPRAWLGVIPLQGSSGEYSLLGSQNSCLQESGLPYPTESHCPFHNREIPGQYELGTGFALLRYPAPS